MKVRRAASLGHAHAAATCAGGLNRPTTPQPARRHGRSLPTPSASSKVRARGGSAQGGGFQRLVTPQEMVAAIVLPCSLDLTARHTDGRARGVLGAYPGRAWAMAIARANVRRSRAVWVVRWQRHLAVATENTPRHVGLVARGFVASALQRSWHARLDASQSGTIIR